MIKITEESEKSQEKDSEDDDKEEDFEDIDLENLDFFLSRGWTKIKKGPI